jgi:ABC-2 type transport system permease protein
MLANEYLGFTVIFVALMTVFTVVRHTRAEEETGRAELVRANVVGRNAQLTAALLTAAIANLILGLLVAAGLASLGIETVDWAGSLLYGAGFVAVGFSFAGLTAVTAQVSAYSRAASGMGGALIAVAYALRALGDVGGNGLSWISPIGWAQATGPYVLNRWWPIGLALVMTAAFVAAAFALSRRRDLGSGLRAEGAGAAHASAFLQTPTGFAWRLQRATVLWWAVGLFLFGLVYGSAVNTVESYANNQVVKNVVRNIAGKTLTESWLAMIIEMLAIVTTVFAITAALRPHREETSGRAELVLSTALSRIRWVLTHVLVAMAGGLALLFLAGAGMGASAALASGDGAYFGKSVEAAVSYAPALWLTTALAVAVFGFIPRLIWLAWALLAYSFFVVYLGGLLNLPHWMLNLSPFQHVPRLPVDDFTAVPLVILAAIAVGLVAVGLVGFRNRDVEAG